MAKTPVYGVTDILITRLKHEIEKQRFNYKSLSAAAGLGETAVRDIVTGRARNPRRDTLQKIAAALGLPLSYFLIANEYNAAVASEKTEMGFPPKVFVSEHEQTYLSEPTERLDALFAFRIKGDALAPFLHDGTLLYCRERMRLPGPDDLHRLCAVRSVAGEELAGILKPGAYYQMYDLVNYDGTCIARHVEPEWHARAVFIKLL